MFEGDIIGQLTWFEDISIYMNHMDNDRYQEPHFHIELSDGKEASISISNGIILAEKHFDKIPPRINF